MICLEGRWNIFTFYDKTLAHSYVGDATKFLQDALNEEAAGTVRDKMVINDTKCNIITFNFSRKNTKPQNLLLNGNPIKSVEKITVGPECQTLEIEIDQNRELLKPYKVCRNHSKCYPTL